MILKQSEKLANRAAVKLLALSFLHHEFDVRTFDTIAEMFPHKVPVDLQKILVSDPKALAKWEDLTPLARNEWICWVIFVKKAETRKQHVKRVIKELKEGKRRPCCWLGCIHRTDKSVSPSVQRILSIKTYGRIKN